MPPEIADPHILLTEAHEARMKTERLVAAFVIAVLVAVFFLLFLTPSVGTELEKAYSQGCPDNVYAGVSIPECAK